MYYIMQMYVYLKESKPIRIPQNKKSPSTAMIRNEGKHNLIN